MKFFHLLSLCLALTLATLTASCVDESSSASAGAAPVSSQAAPGVQWPALMELDEAALRAEALAESDGQEAQLRGAVAKLKEVAMRVAQEEPPANAIDPDLVRLHQMELQSLAEGIAAPMTLPEQDLRDSTEGFHEIGAALMAAAGVPHVHGDHDDHDHDHSADTDHDHDEHHHADGDHDH